MTPTNTPLSVAILAFDDMEVLDYAGPNEVFNVAAELSEPAAFNVMSVGVTGTAIVGRGGFTVIPDHTLASCPAADIVVIPGGFGSRRLVGDDAVLDWVRDAAQHVEHLLSVCTGALVLAAAGLLEDKDATTHHDAFEELAALSPSTKIHRGERFVRADERIWTSGGISAGVDLALEIAELCAGGALKTQVIEQMEWGW